MLEDQRSLSRNYHSHGPMKAFVSALCNAAGEARQEGIWVKGPRSWTYPTWHLVPSYYNNSYPNYS